MKRVPIILLFLFASLTCLSQEVRDHRSTKPQPTTGTRDHRATPPPPSQPPPSRDPRGKQPVQEYVPGAIATTIDPNKWYFIKLSGTQRYMMISGHKDVARSMAKLTVNEIMPDNNSQQWRFVPKDPGSSVYTIENRRYRGTLLAAPRFSYLEFRRDHVEQKEKLGPFTMVSNQDRSWFIFPLASNNKKALATSTAKGAHCATYYDGGGLLIGGRVIHESECTDEGTFEFVQALEYTGKPDQRWTLEEAKPLNSK